MTTTQLSPTAVTCRCGQVAMEVSGPPIAHAACYCESCRKAGHLIEALPGAAAVVGADGGTDYVLWRKDRFRCVAGGDKLLELKLKPNAPTRRLVAGCCNTAMVLEVGKAHWATLYRDHVQGPVPPLEMRLMTAERPDGAVLPDDAPNYPGRTGKFFGKLLKAWLAMGFRLPGLAGVPAGLERLSPVSPPTAGRFSPAAR